MRMWPGKMKVEIFVFFFIVPAGAQGKSCERDIALMGVCQTRNLVFYYKKTDSLRQKEEKVAQSRRNLRGRVGSSLHSAFE